MSAVLLVSLLFCYLLCCFLSHLYCCLYLVLFFFFYFVFYCFLDLRVLHTCPSRLSSDLLNYGSFSCFSSACCVLFLSFIFVSVFDFTLYFIRPVSRSVFFFVFFFLMIRRPPNLTFFPYPTLFRSCPAGLGLLGFLVCLLLLGSLPWVSIV